MKLIKKYMNEKFTESDSDPIKDLGIGIYHFWEEQLKILKEKYYIDVYNEYFYPNFPTLPRTLGEVLIYVLENLLKKQTAEIAFKNALIRTNLQNYTPGERKRNIIKLLLKVLKEKFYVDFDYEKIESLNEKFTEDSDPIVDMNIGMKHFLKEYTLENVTKENIVNLRKSSIEKLEYFFNTSKDNIYFLGDTWIASETKNEYFKNLNKLITHKTKYKQPKFNSYWLLKSKKDTISDNIFSKYETTVGKIATIEYLELDSVEIAYFGDLEMAIHVDILKNNILEEYL